MRDALRFARGRLRRPSSRAAPLRALRAPASARQCCFRASARLAEAPPARRRLHSIVVFFVSSCLRVFVSFVSFVSFVVVSPGCRWEMSRGPRGGPCSLCGLGASRRRPRTARRHDNDVVHSCTSRQRRVVESASVRLECCAGGCGITSRTCCRIQVDLRMPNAHRAPARPPRLAAYLAAAHRQRFWGVAAAEPRASSRGSLAKMVSVGVDREPEPLGDALLGRSRLRDPRVHARSARREAREDIRPATDPRCDRRSTRRRSHLWERELYGRASQIAESPR